MTFANVVNISPLSFRAQGVITPAELKAIVR